MKKEEVIQKVEESIPKINEFIREYTNKACSVGAFDLETEKDVNRLAVIITAAATQELGYHLIPTQRSYRHEVENLIALM